MSGWNTGPAGPPPKDLQAELREAIEKSIGMRERDQHDAMIDFGEGKITKEQLQALSDESRKLFTEDLLALFQAREQKLLTELLEELPEKLDELPHNNNPMWDNNKGFNRALDQVVKILEMYREGL